MNGAAQHGRARYTVYPIVSRMNERPTGTRRPSPRPGPRSGRDDLGVHGRLNSYTILNGTVPRSCMYQLSTSERPRLHGASPADPCCLRSSHVRPTPTVRLSLRRQGEPVLLGLGECVLTVIGSALHEWGGAGLGEPKCNVYSIAVTSRVY